MIDSHGEQLHAFGWTDLDLFGLHAAVLERRPDCLCLAWVLHRRTIVEVAADRVVMTSAAGVTLTFSPSHPGLAEPRVLAWNLGDAERRLA